MPLQNRVTPFGELVATPARGAWMGNRGRLHDAERRIVRRVVPSYRAWVTCVLEFRGRRRTVMTPGRYTELFFLDEATALAAGHRPCGECRRADFLRFKNSWLSGNRDRGVGETSTISALDRELQRDRLEADGRQQTTEGVLDTLPDGVFVTLPDRPDEALLLWRGALWSWTAAGYEAPRRRQDVTPRVTILTPRSTVAAVSAGYAPAVHESAGP